MQLPPRQLQALVDIKKDLLSREESVPLPAPAKEKKDTRTFKGHNVPQGNAYQRGCQRHAFWSPVH
jgi:hypothetical protein